MSAAKNKPPMSRNDRRQLKKANKKQPLFLCPIPKKDWPPRPIDFCSEPIAVYRSRDFLAQVYPANDGVIRISVNRTIKRPDGDWMDDISWDEMQAIKRQCGYSHRQAIEIYPADNDIVNVANMRHLWLLPTAIDVGWKKNASQPR